MLTHHLLANLVSCRCHQDQPYLRIVQALLLRKWGPGLQVSPPLAMCLRPYQLGLHHHCFAKGDLAGCQSWQLEFRLLDLNFNLQPLLLWHLPQVPSEVARLGQVRQNFLRR